MSTEINHQSLAFCSKSPMHAPIDHFVVGCTANSSYPINVTFPFARAFSASARRVFPSHKFSGSISNGIDNAGPHAEQFCPASTQITGVYSLVVAGQEEGMAFKCSDGTSTVPSGGTMFNMTEVSYTCTGGYDSVGATVSRYL